MESKQKEGAHGETHPSPRRYLFACFPIARRKTLQWLSSAILTPQGGTNASDSRRRLFSHRSSSRNFISHSGPIFSKVPASTGRQGSQEPTSPEVTCLGQVRVKEKQHKCPEAAASLEKIYHERRHKIQKTSSETKSQTDSISGPKQSTWRQILGSRGSVSPQACPSDDTDEIDLRRFSSSCKISGSELPRARSMNSKAGIAFAKSIRRLSDETSNHSKGEKEESVDDKYDSC